MHMKKLMGVFAAVAVTVSGAEAVAEPAAPAPAQKKAHIPAPEETLTLELGKTRDLEVKDMSRVAVGNQEFADIAIDGKGATVLHITGKKPGETTLLVWTKDGERRAFKLVIQG
jgi:Flp pilus assembly secretin CpaC